MLSFMILASAKIRIFHETAAVGGPILAETEFYRYFCRPQ